MTSENITNYFVNFTNFGYGALNTKIVEVIKEWTNLYNFKPKTYSNCKEVDQSWTKIAQKMHDSGKYSLNIVRN